MNKEEITHNFEVGIQQFNDGEPMPEDRCQVMGWRFARDMAREKSLRLDTAFEAFIEKKSLAEQDNKLDGTYYILVASKKGSSDIQIGYEAAKYSIYGGTIKFSAFELGKAKFHRIKHWKETASNYGRATKFLREQKEKNKLQLPQGYRPEVGQCWVQNGLIIKVI